MFSEMQIITCDITSVGLSRMVTAGISYSNRTPSVAANSAGLFVAKQAWFDTPFTNPSRIDTELSVEVTPVVATRGARKGQPLRSGRKNITADPNRGSGKDPHPDVPLTWLIISARAKHGSNYNNTTANRWAINGGVHPLKGKQISQFKQIIAGYVQRMASGRHSGTHFVQQGWIPSIRDLEAFVPQYVRRGSGGPPRSTRINSSHGSATPAAAGSINAVCTIENAIGMSGQYGILDARRNQALWNVGAPPLQRAIDKETLKQMEYVSRKEFEASFGNLRSSGITINI
jgi:hypothetical protein